MSELKTAALLILLAVSPIAIATGVPAQVTTADEAFAQSAIMSAGSRAARVARIDRVPAVGVVRLDFHSRRHLGDGRDDNLQQWRIMAERNYAGIRKLRAALSANRVTRDALSAHGVAVNRVVGVQISSNGSLRLYLLRP